MPQTFASSSVPYLIRSNSIILFIFELNYIDVISQNMVAIALIIVKRQIQIELGWCLNEIL